MSAILGVISLITLVLVTFLSYANQGENPENYGATVFITSLFSLTGVILGLMGLLEKGKFRFFPGLGLGLNIVAGIITAFIVYIGLT